MPNQRKYPIGLRERAIRMVLDALKADPSSRRDLFRRVGDQLGINLEALRSWINQAETYAADRPGITIAESERIKDLENENRELRRAN